MKKINRILSVCAVLALLIGCAVFSANAAATVTPSNDTYTETTACPHCGEVVTWTELTTINDDIVTASGHYVVKAGTTLTFDKTSAIGANASDVAILVIGNINFTGSGHLRVGNRGTTTTWLIGGGGTISGGHAPTTTPNPSLVGVYTNGTLNIIGNITIKGNETEAVTANRGGVINVYDKGQVNMYGGTITPFNLAAANESSYAGIYLRNGGTFNMHGGSIAGGSAKYGPCVYIANGTFTMDGGSISGGTSSSSGAAIYLSAGSLNITGSAQVAGGTCGGSGGAIYQNDGATSISGNAQITGAAANYGGVAYVNAGTFEVSGNAQLTGASVKNYGGTIYCKGTLTISGGTLNGGSATHGGTIGINGSSTNITGGVINGGSATKQGGTIYMHTSAGEVTFSNGTINGGTTANGGAIYMAAGTFTMTGGQINSGTASTQGSVACVYGGATFNMSGGVVNNTKLGKSGIRVQGSSKLYLHGNALIKAGAGGMDAIQLVGTSSTPATLVLAGNAQVGDLDGKKTNVHNITLQGYPTDVPTNYPRLRVANDWTGYAAFTDTFGSKATGDIICAVTSGDTTKYYAQCGTWDAATTTFTQGGTFDSSNLIHGSADDGDLPVFGEEGKLMLPRAKAVVEGITSWHRTADRAVDTACEGGYAVLYRDDTAPITIDSGDTAYVDFNGHKATITGSGKLLGTDSSALETGTGTAEVTFDGVDVKTVSTAPATGETFIAITDGNKATFHAVTADITSITVRPDKLGMYYSAKFVCDDTVKAHLDTFGVALSLSGMPDADFAKNKSVLYTAATKDQLASGEYNSVLVKGIMKEGLSENKARGEMPVYANAYLKLTVNNEPITVMATSTAQHSLKTMLQEINTYWDTFPETAQSDLATKVYDPYVRNFGADDWKLYNLRIKANGGYTPEEEAILKERRDTVLAYMRESVSLLWKSDKTLTYGLGNTERDNGASFTIEAGKLYKGLPYVYGAGTQDAFLEYAGKPDENGIYTITGLEATALNYEYYGGRVGNDCSGAVTNAWSLISTTLNGTTSSACHPYYGVVPVGNYAFNSPISETNRLLDTKYVVDTNGEQVMYEAYAMLKPADAAFHQEYPSTRGNHIRMVVSVNVVRNEDGTINGTKSTITMLEQTRTQINANVTEKHPVTGETIYVIGGVDKTYKFSTLFSQHYIPVTIKELRDPSPVEETWVDDTLEEDTIENLFTGSIIANRYLDSVRITIYNENGEIVQQTTGRRSRSVVKEYLMSRFLTEKPGSMLGQLDLDALEAGNYRCTVTVKLTIDDDYVHTARDFTFSK